MYALDGQWDDALERRLEAEVSAAWGDDSLLSPLRRASSGIYAIGPTASPAIVTCYYLKTFNEEEELSPSKRFSRDLNLVGHTANSIARRLLEPQVVMRLDAGWRMVLERQRFALSAPARNAPLIDSAVQSLAKVGMRGARALFEAAAPAVGIQLPANWETFLTLLEGRPEGHRDDI